MCISSSAVGTSAPKHLKFADLSCSFLLICLMSKDEKKTRGQAGPSDSHISWSSACGLHSQKHTWTDSGRILPRPFTPTGLPLGQWRPCCHPCRSQHLDPWTHPLGKRRVCVCVQRRGGEGVSWEMNQPLSSATRPLTYRARFSKNQRSTLTLSRISLSLLAISHYFPHLSHQRWTRSYFRVMRETEAGTLCVIAYVCLYVRNRIRNPHFFHQNSQIPSVLQAELFLS